MSKSLFASKTFWLQVAGAVALAVPGLPLDPQTIGYLMAGLTVINRVLSDGAVHVIPPANEP